MNTDSAQYILRFNEISNVLEFGSGSNWFPITLSNTSGTVIPAAGTGTITPSATNTSIVTITVTGNLTIDGPSSPINGQKIVFRILNDSSHSVTFATGAGNFRFGTTIPSYTNSVSLTDYIGVIYNSPAGVWDIVALSQGF